MDNSQNQSHPGSTVPCLALVGCGAIAEEYYFPVLAKRPQVMEKLILVDRDLDRAKKLAKTYNASRYVSDYREIIDETDGAIIALPTNLHYPVSMDFLSWGRHVLCEKPLAENANSARELVEMAEKKGVSLAVNYLQRLIPVFAQSKEWITQKTYGELHSIKYNVGEEFDWPSVSGFYFNSPVSARGALRDRGAHIVDHICWWLGGKPELVSSKNDAFGGSEALAHITFHQGKVAGEIRLSWFSTIPCKFVLEFDRATVIGDVYDYLNITVDEKTGKNRQLRLNSKYKTKLDIAGRVVDNFINVVRKTEQPLVAGKDVLDSVEFIDECYAKATRLETPWYTAMKEGKNA